MSLPVPGQVCLPIDAVFIPAHCLLYQPLAGPDQTGNQSPLQACKVACQYLQRTLHRGGQAVHTFDRKHTFESKLRVQAERRRAAEAAAESEAAARAEATCMVLEKQLQQEADLQQVWY